MVVSATLVEAAERLHRCHKGESRATVYHEAAKRIPPGQENIAFAVDEFAVTDYVRALKTKDAYVDGIDWRNVAAAFLSGYGVGTVFGLDSRFGASSIGLGPLLGGACFGVYSMAVMIHMELNRVSRNSQRQAAGGETEE